MLPCVHIYPGPEGRPIVKRAIIVTPGSLVKNWEQEIKKWLGNERLRCYAVDSTKKVAEFKVSEMLILKVRDER